MGWPIVLRRVSATWWDSWICCSGLQGSDIMAIGKQPEIYPVFPEPSGELTPTPIFTSVDEPIDTIFDEAKKIVYKDREKVYGDPGKNIRAIAALWNVYIKHKYAGTLYPELNEQDVCAMMRLLKEARLMNTPSHRDSLVDICGYAGVDVRIDEHKKNAKVD